MPKNCGCGTEYKSLNIINSFFLMIDIFWLLFFQDRQFCNSLSFCVQRFWVASKTFSTNWLMVVVLWPCLWQSLCFSFGFINMKMKNKNKKNNKVKYGYISLSVCLRTKWLWIQISLLSLKYNGYIFQVITCQYKQLQI